MGPGVFIWLQTLGSVVFGQFDRILLGVSLGALAVAPYALCVQFAQPIFGLTASALHFLFPYLSGRVGVLSNTELKQTLLKVFAVNLLMVVCGAGLLIAAGDHLIRLWGGQAVAASAKEIFVPIVLGSALMGLSVTGTYAMQALGLFRTAALISLSGRAAMFMLMIYLLHHMGLRGLAVSRVCYGLVALVVYLPLLRELRITRRKSSSAQSMAIACDLQEGAQP
jgi:O-antigen/teichoic acid export membrane protein